MRLLQKTMFQSTLLNFIDVGTHSGHMSELKSLDRTKKCSYLRDYAPVRILEIFKLHHIEFKLRRQVSPF